MYAVFEDGSRQYRVQEGDVLLLDFRDVPQGERLTFDRVLLYNNADDTRIGQPVIAGARVLAEVLRRPTDDDPQPSKKVYVQKFRRRKGYRRLRGHRQPYTEVRIRHILLPGMEPPTETPATPPPPATTPAEQSTPATPPTPPAPPASETPQA